MQLNPESPINTAGEARMLSRDRLHLALYDATTSLRDGRHAIDVDCKHPAGVFTQQAALAQIVVRQGRRREQAEILPCVLVKGPLPEATAQGSTH